MRVARLRPAYRDLLLAAGTATLLEVSIRVSYVLGARRPTLSTYLMAALIAVPLLLRRRHPLRVLLACSVLLFIFYFFQAGAGLIPSIPLGVALYAAAADGKLRWTLAISGFFILAGYLGLTLVQRQSPLRIANLLAVEAALLGAICLLGDAVHSRRGWAAETQRRVAQAALEREHEADRRVTEERLRIARELHDVLAHSISALAIQARVIADGLPDAPAPVRAATDAILATSREAMADVRAAVGLLRGRDDRTDHDAAPPPPAPGVARLETVLAIARSSGLTARCDVVGEPVRLPALVDLTAFRIVQEAVTNVVRHAGARAVTVTVYYRPRQLEIEVDDDGRGPAGPGAGGFGLRGMHERAEALGGELLAGAGPRGGFRVTARLPLPAAIASPPR